MVLTAFTLLALVLEYNYDSTNGIHDSLFCVTVYFGNCPSQSRKVVQAVDSSSVCRKGSTFYCEEYCTKRFNKEDEQVMGGRCLQSRKGYKFSGYVGYGKGPGASDTKCIEDVNSELLPEDIGNPLCKFQNHKTCTEKCLSTYINAEKGLCRQKYGEKYECVCKTCGPAERFNLGPSGVLGTVDCRDIAPPLPLCLVVDWLQWSASSGGCGAGCGNEDDVVMNEFNFTCPDVVQSGTCNMEPCLSGPPGPPVLRQLPSSQPNNCRTSGSGDITCIDTQPQRHHRSIILGTGDSNHCIENLKCEICNVACLGRTNLECAHECFFLFPV